METEEQNVTSAEATNEPVSFESALDRLNTPDEPAAPETAEAAPEGDEADKAEAPATEEEATPEAAPDDDDFVNGHKRTRLRDGTVTTVAELKKEREELLVLRASRAELDAKRQETEAKLTQIAQQEQQTAQLIQNAKRILSLNVPPEPDYAAYQRGELDVITFTEQQVKRTQFEKEWNNLTRAEQANSQKAENETKAQTQKRIEDETKLFIDRADLKTPEAQKAFADDVLKIGQEHYGFTPQDLAQKMDHRDLLVLKDAIAYRKLQADKPKALEKVKDVPPVTVQAPGRRVSAPERAAQAVSDKLAAARRSGGLSMADALSLINDI